jgi:hypothetical protein
MLCFFKKFGFRFGAWIWHIRRAYQTCEIFRSSGDVETRRANLLPQNGTQPFTVCRGAREPGIYAVEHTAPGFLGSLALCFTEGSVSNPL